MKEINYISDYDYYVGGHCLFHNEYSLDDRTRRLVSELAKNKDENMEQLHEIFRMWLHYKAKLKRNKEA